jgi:antirestriction protein ArdC/uncharacterized protein YjbI with pentapeptide repeats/predicted ABC-type ATPase
MAALSSKTMSKMRALRQAQKLGCSGAHQMDDGAWHPCSSHDDYVSAKKRIQSSSVIGTPPQRDARGSNKIKKQWETLGQRPISAIDNIQGGGLVAGAPSALIGGGMASGAGMGMKSLGWAPRDNDPDVFTDVEVARNRSRQLGCIGVSRRVSRGGKTVWMPCTNMSDYARLAGTTSLGRRHMRQAAERTITDAFKKLKPKPKRKRSKSLFSELHLETYKKVLASQVNRVQLDEMEFKGLGPKLGRGLRSAPPGMVFIDVTGAIDADKDGIVFEGKPLERPIIPRFTIPESLAGRVSKLMEGTAEQNEKNRRLSGDPMAGSITERDVQNLVSNLDVGPSGLSSSRRTREWTESTTLTPGVLPPVDAGVPIPKKFVRAAKGTVRARTWPMRNVSGKYENHSNEQLKWLVDDNVISSPGTLRTALEKSPYLVGSPKNIAGRIEDAEIDYDAGQQLAQSLKQQIDTNPAMANFIRKYGLPVMVVTNHQPNTETANFGPNSWMSTMAGWAPNGFIGFNAATFPSSPFYADGGHRDTNTVMNMRHELAHAWETMAAKTNDKAKEHYIAQFAEMFQGLQEIEERGDSTFRTSYHEAAWGTDDEHESALKISNYAETARIEWFAEAFAFATDSDINNRSRVDNLSKQNMAAVLGLDMWELESLLGSGSFSSFDDDPFSRGMSSSSRFGNSIFQSSNNADSEEYIGWLNENPGYIDDAPLEMLLRTDSEALDENRRMGMRSSTGLLGQDEQRARAIIFDRVDKKKLGKQQPTYHHVGGIPGSGKSTLVTTGVLGVPNNNDAFHIDPDEIKTHMDGWNSGRGAQMLHPRSRRLTDLFMAEAAESHGDIVVQGIGKRTEHLAMMRDAGYRTVGHFVYVPSKEADANISKRAEAGGAILGNGYGSHISDELRSRGTISRQITSGLYDEFYLWDNTGRTPKIAAERRQDGTFIIHDQKVWDKFFGDKKYSNGSLSNAEWAKQYFEQRMPESGGMSSSSGIRRNSISLNSINNALQDSTLLPDVSAKEDARLLSTLLKRDNGRILLSNHKLENMDVSNLYIPFPEFNNVDMENCDITNGVMSNGTFINLSARDIDMTNGDLSHSFFANSSIDGSYLAGSNFSNSIIVGNLSLRNTDLRNANLSNLTFSDENGYATIDLAGSMLDGAYLGNTDLTRLVANENTEWGDVNVGYMNSAIPRGLRSEGLKEEERLNSLNLMSAGEIHGAFNDALIDVNSSKDKAIKTSALNNIEAIHSHLSGINTELMTMEDDRRLILERFNSVTSELRSMKNVKLSDGSSINPVKFIESNNIAGWVKEVNAARQKNPSAFKDSPPNKLLADASRRYREQQILLDSLNKFDSEISEAKQKQTLLSSVNSILFADKDSVFSPKLTIPKKANRVKSNRDHIATVREQVSSNTIKDNRDNLNPRAVKMLKQFSDIVAGDIVGMRSTKATNDSKKAEDKIEEMYSKLSDAILASLDEADGDGWVRPWNLGAFLPRNAKTKQAYRGSNVFNLGITQTDAQYKHPMWGTYKMWQELGGQVQKGERGTIIVHWSPMEKEIIGPGGAIETRKYMRPRLHNVFNIDQVTGVDPEKYELPALSDEQRVQRMDSVIEELGATIRESTNMPTRNGGFGLRAFYNPTDDSISLPPFSTFTEPIGYYQTAMHELVHWTGHSSRLDRLNMTEFGNEDYAYEELVAEFGSAFLMGILGMEAEPQQNHSAYIKGWKRKIKDDPNTVKNAIADAQKAVNYILNNSSTFRDEFGMNDVNSDANDSDGILPVAGELGDIVKNAIPPSSGVPGPVSSGRDMVGMRSARLSEWMDVTDADSFGQSGIELRNTFGRPDLEKLQKVLKDEQSALSKTIDEWQKTGIWNGQTNGVALPRTLYPKNGITRNISVEELSTMGDKDALGSIFNNYLSQIEKQLNHVNTRLSDLNRFENGDDISNINSISIRDLPTFAALAKRGKQIRNGRSGKDDGSWSLTTDDPDAVWLIHTGAPVLENGVLDPSFTLPKGGDGTYLRQGMDTQRLNGVTRRNLINLYEEAQRDVDSYRLALKKYDETGIWDGEGLANNLKLPAFQRNHNLFNNYTEGKDDDKISPQYLRETAQSVIDGGLDTMARNQYAYGQAKAGKEHLSYSHISMGPSTGYVRDDFPTSKTYLVRVPKKEVISGYPPGEYQIFGTRTPVASFEFPSRFNDSVEVLDVAIALFEKAAQKHISRDKSPSGMLSRRDLVSLHGKTLQEVLNTLEIDEAESLRGMEELKTAIGHLDDRKIRKAPFHPEVRDSVNDIIDSIAVSVSSDGIIMLHSKPNPIFQKEYPVQRDWRLIELTKPENVEAALKKALENQLTTKEDGEWINYYSPAGELVARKRYTGETGNEDSIEGMYNLAEWEVFDDRYVDILGGDGGELSRFEDFLESLLKKLSKGSRVNPQKADKLIPINNLFVGSFLASLINPEAGNALGGRDGLHDAFGHFAMGRGVDRHGEWANALAIMSLVDHPDFDATPAERNAIKQSWFGEYGLYFVTNFNEEVTIEPTTLWGAIANYAGNFDDILNILDDSPHSSSGMSSRSMPIGRAGDLMLKEISDQEILHNKKRALIIRAQNNPGVLSSSEDYRMSHTAPLRDAGAPLSDLTGNGIYPEDVYTDDGYRMYSHGQMLLNSKMFKLIKDMRGKPDKEITIYRAVPKNVGDDINAGDWVSPLREYAQYHGESNLDGDYKIVSKKVKAGDIFTEGNSWMEWGYSPSDDSRTGMSSVTTPTRPTIPPPPSSPVTPARPIIPPPPGAPAGQAIQNPEATPSVRPTLSLTREAADAIEDFRNAIKVDDNDPYTLNASSFVGHLDNIFAQTFLSDLPEGHNVLIRDIPITSKTKAIPYAVATKINGALVIKQITQETYDYLYRVRKLDKQLYQRNNTSYSEQMNLKAIEYEIRNIAELSKKYKMKVPQLLLIDAANENDKFLQEKYGNPNFSSAATMSANGVMTVYNGELPSVHTMRHEWGHAFDRVAERISEDAEGIFRLIKQWHHEKISDGVAWRNASDSDKKTSREWKNQYLGKGWTVRFASRPFKVGTDAVTDYSQSSYDLGEYSLVEDFAESVALFLIDRELGYMGKKYTSEGGERGNVRFATLYPKRAEILTALFDQSDDWMRSPQGMSSKTKKFDDRFEKKYSQVNPDGDGDCYSAAFNLLENLTERFGKQEGTEVRMVHGIPLGTGGEAAGIRYGHAWVEVDMTPGEILRLNEKLRVAKTESEKARIEANIRQLRLMGDVTVYDYSNGGRHEIPKFLYYAMGNIDESEVRRYSLDESRKYALNNKHYGPWK